jgi:hypothetical protein
MLLGHVSSYTMEDFDKLYAEAQSPGAQIVSLVDDMLVILVALKLAYNAFIHPKRVGIHMSNRFGFGVAEDAVHHVGEQIHNDGFSWCAVDKAVCIEDDPATRIHANYTIELTKDVVSLANFVVDDIAFAALACTHTNQFLCAAIDGCPTNRQAIAEHGRISMHMMETKNAKCREAFTKGLEWTVIKRSVEVNYELFPGMVQHARNKVGLVQKDTDIWETMLAVQKMSMRARSLGMHPDWDAITTYTKGIVPKTFEDAECIIDFIKLYGSDSLVYETQAFAKKHVPVGVFVPPPIFAAISKLKVEATDLCPRFMHAVLRTCASGKKNTNKVALFLGTGDVATLQKAAVYAQAKAAEKLMATARELCSTTSLSADALTRLYGWLDTVLVRFVLKKPTGTMKFQSAQQVALQFLKDVNLLLPTGQTLKVPKAWGKSCAEAPPQVPTTVAPSSCIDFSGDNPIGVVTQLLTLRGFVPKQVVVSKDLVATIGALDETSVSLINVMTVDGQAQADQMIHYKEFVSMYKIGKENVWLDLTALDARISKEYEVDYVKSMIRTRLGFEISTIDLRIRDKPSKGVFANMDFKAKSLLIYPLTLRILALSPGELHPKNGFEVHQQHLSDYRFFVMPYYSKDSVSAFWYVTTTTEMDNANVFLKYKTLAADGTNGELFSMRVPYFVNANPIGVSEEVVAYLPWTEEEKPRAKRQLLVGKLHDHVKRPHCA